MSSFADAIIQGTPPADGRNWECQCARCGSSADWIDCWACVDGMAGHDCGEDCCMCLRPEENVICEICGGNGGGWRCLAALIYCEENPMDGREQIVRGAIEWFTVERNEREQDIN